MAATKRRRRTFGPEPPVVIGLHASSILLLHRGIGVAAVMLERRGSGSAP
jgi:hypothetical protein